MSTAAVFLDTETTGREPGRHEIIQVAAVAVSGSYEEIESFERKIRFDVAKADPEALEINSYEPVVWEKTAVEAGKAVADFASWLAPHRSVEKISKAGRPYRVAQAGGHNIASFDLPFLRKTFRRLGEFLPLDYFGLDTLHLAVWVKAAGHLEGAENLRLETLARTMGIDYEAHDALEDVRANVQVARQLCRLMGVE